jgi:1,4-dihydroxy-2-naphthoate octaprenyltransferase
MVSDSIHLTDSGAGNDRRGVYLLAGLYALATGAIAAALLFAGLSFWSLVIALAVLAALVAASALRDTVRQSLGVLSAFAVAFALLAWPVELVVAAGIWGHWE